MQIDFAKCQFDKDEIEAVNSVLSGYWLASGPENEAFETEFAEYVGVKYAICVNSGSSANLLALTVLGLSSGSLVLSSACGFPATISPILHLGLQPSLLDYDLKTHNISEEEVFDKLRDGDIKAIIYAHTLGNPVSEDIAGIAQTLDIPVIEDCCEAVGTKLNFTKSVGSFGTLGTFSFYPAHQMTAMGGGGMIVTEYEQLAKECRSLRDWGKVYDWDTKLGDTKTTYTSMIDDINYYKHYTYNSIGYNAKLPEACAAFGRVQLKKLDKWVEIRRNNYYYLNDKISKLGTFHKIETIPNSKISWFGYPLTLINGNGDRRRLLGDWLENHGIRTRPFFAGNITRHKPFRHLYKEGQFPIADKLMRDSLFIGIGQWIGKVELDYIVESIESWILSRSVS